MDEALRRQLHESIRQWEARPRYAELTPALLATVADEMLEQVIVDFVLDHRVWRDDELMALLHVLPIGFATVYTTWILDAEVANGGLHQYFWNTAGLYGDLVRRGLALLGADGHLRTFDQAVHLASLQTRPDVSNLDARAELDKFSESALGGTFEHLDNRWSELGELAPTRVRLIREHPTLFIGRLPLLARARLAISAAWNGRRTSRSRPWEHPR